MTDEEERLFLIARDAIDRGAPQRYMRAEVVDQNDEAAVQAADARFRSLPLLLLPPLRLLALQALEESRGPMVHRGTPFPATLWLDGATDTQRGKRFTGTISSFVGMLEQRAKEIAVKRSGWVIQPTTNTDGHRTNASTTQMHALFLDCDGGGEWHALLADLERLGFAFVAYRSGGDSPGAPKWRVVCPLATPFVVTDDAKRAAWKAVYGHARVVFGAIAGILGEGFDGAVDAPAIPWFLTEKRNATDSERQVVFREGHSLDLTGLALALPPIEIDKSVRGSNGQVPTITLASDKYRLLVEGLVLTTANVRSRRRDLYLSLPGVLLSRGVAPDDVMAIVDEISARYPRPGDVRHRDNVRAARTTISRWERGEPVTQIGTLNEIWPAVAKAVDAVLPNELEAMLQESMGSMCGPPVLQVLPPPPPPQMSGDMSPYVPSPSIAISSDMIMNMIRKLTQRLRKQSTNTAQLESEMIERFIVGKALITPIEISRGGDAIAVLSGESGLHRIAKQMGNALETIPWEAVLLIRPRTSSENYDADVLARAGEVFTSTQKSRAIYRAEQEQKRVQEKQAYREQLDAYYQAKRA